MSPFIAQANLAPEINLTGNSVSIADGDLTPSLTDHTDFASTLVTGGTVVRTFTIQNIGAVDLALTGTPKVAVSGPHAADFTITLLPVSPVVTASAGTVRGPWGTLATPPPGMGFYRIVTP